MLVKVAKSKMQGWALSSYIGSIFIYISLGINLMQLIGPFKAQSACSLNLSQEFLQFEWPVKVLALTIGGLISNKTNPSHH